MKAAYSPHKVEKKQIKPLGDAILVSDMVFDERITTGGIVLLTDNGKGTGIRPRWGRVYAVGPQQESIKVGQWILVAHGRWTRGLDIEDEDGAKTIRKIDPKEILLVSDDPQGVETFSDAVHIDKKTR